MLAEYRKAGGTETNTTRFIQRIKEYIKDEIYCFKASGVASLIMQKEKASTILKLVSNEEEDDYLEIEKVSKQIKEEIKSLPVIRKGYPLLDDAKIETHNSTNY